MSIKVEQASTAASSAASTNSPKISMFAAKPGFVIPRNKLSGAFVPRGGKKPGATDVVNEESVKQVQRKTKWGPDLTQDAAVRKGRALAYQARVDQITEQLKLRTLETDNQDLTLAASRSLDHEPVVHQINSKELVSLEIERREAIGEIMKLNPSYKAPPDYKPVLKEAKVPIPIKDYPGYNFIGLIFGPANDTQKRLEKETGAKIQVYGTKADKKEKGEITSSDGNENHGAYEELYVHVSAETYEKVDAAVALIELLVTPVSVNTSAPATTSASVSGDSLNVVNQSQSTPAPYTIPSLGVNQGLTLPIMGSTQAPGQSQFQLYPGPWFASGPNQTLTSPPSGFIPPPNTSASILTHPVQLSSSPMRPANMPSLFGRPPVPTPGFGSIPQNPSLVAPRPLPPVLQRPYMPQAAPARNPFSPAQPNMSVAPPFSANPSTPTGPPSIVRPLMPSPPLPMQSPSGPHLDRPFTPVPNSTQWSQPLARPIPPIGSNSMRQMVPPIFPPQVPHPVTSQSMVPSGAPPPPFTSLPQPQVGFSPASSSMLTTPAPPPNQSSQFSPMQPGIMHGGSNPSPNPGSGSMPILSQVAATPTLPPPPQSGLPSFLSGIASNVSPMKPSVSALRPPNPNAGDFTFQPHRPQNPASQAVPRPNSQPTLLPNPAVQTPLAPQSPSFRPAITSQHPVMQGFPRPQLHNQVNQPQAQAFPPFTPNSNASPNPLRNAAFPNPVPIPAQQIGGRNFTPAPQMVNLGGHFPSRPGNPPPQFQHNYPPLPTRPQDVLASNQQFNSKPSSAYFQRPSAPVGTQQIYDPFSPTSVPLKPQPGGNAAASKKQDSDPEYEDLMASVGVK